MPPANFSQFLQLSAPARQPRLSPARRAARSSRWKASPCRPRRRPAPPRRRPCSGVRGWPPRRRRRRPSPPLRLKARMPVGPPACLRRRTQGAAPLRDQLEMPARPQAADLRRRPPRIPGRTAAPQKAPCRTVCKTPCQRPSAYRNLTAPGATKSPLMRETMSFKSTVSSFSSW